MSLNSTELSLVIAHVARLCESGRVRKVYGRDKWSVVLNVAGPAGKVFVLVSAHPLLSRVHTLLEKGEWAVLTPFVKALRQRLHGARVKVVEADDGDRRCRFQFDTGDACYTLECEMFGIGSNLVLVADDGRVVECLHHVRGEKRTLLPGRPYVPPPPVRPRPIDSRFGDAPAAVDAAVREACEPRQAQHDLDDARQRVRSRLKAVRKRADGKVQSLRKAIERLALAEAEKQKGELLKASMHLIKPGLDAVRVVDYFDPETPEVEIKIDAKLAPAANVERYFKRYRKIKTAAELAEHELPPAERELAKAQEAEARLEQTATLEEIADIEQSFFGDVGRGKPKGKPAPTGPRHFTAIDGSTILVGRSEAENDQVTFRMANGNDYWFHVQGMPGSHVVVKAQKGKSLPLETLLDAAALAKLYSSAKDADAADVDYTQRKYVRKRKAGGPGNVDYWDYKTLHVRRDEGRLKRLFSEDGR